MNETDAPDPKLEDRFAFGENWLSFLSTVDAASISEAEHGLRRLFPNDELRNRRFLDIGCGSGLSMLAAHRLGALTVAGIDIDPRSVSAASQLLAKHAAPGSWSVRQQSVFDIPQDQNGSYEIVHSWGVLHHTGNMWQAIARCAALIAPGGLFALALYRRTPLCSFWTAEKKFYAAASAPWQAAVRSIYKSAYFVGLLAKGRNPVDYVKNYRSARGMDWHHDVHDWLGGYPYESTAPKEIEAFLNQYGFAIERVFEHPAAAKGLFGSHCDEYVARKTS